MCRLYGFRATHPTVIECSLLRAQNALVMQSMSDSRHRSNADGWGIASYDGGRPVRFRSPIAAYGDWHFGYEAARIASSTVVSHLRAATKGAVSVANTHPFVYGPWTFAHNGTLEPFDRLRPLLMADVDENLRSVRQGQTDSELIFLWLLSRMKDYDLDPLVPAENVAAVARLVGSAVLELSARSAAFRSSPPPRLNLMLTDGTALVASRWGNTLHWVERQGVPDCALCGMCHAAEWLPDYQSVVIASEPITGEAWQAVPEGTVIAADRSVQTGLHDLLTRPLRHVG